MARSDVLDCIYDVVTREDALGPMLAAIASRFGCPSGLLVYHDTGLPLTDVDAGYGLFDAEARIRYFRDFAAIDPAPAAFSHLTVGEATATDRLFTAEEQANLPFLRDFFHPLGLREAMAGPVAVQGPRRGVLVVHRGPCRPSFTDEEIADFADLATHVARAVDLRRRFFAMGEAVETASTALDEVAGGIMAFDAAGHLTKANAAARDILARGDGLVLSRDGRLGALDRAADALLRALISPHGDGDKPAFIPVPRPGDPRGYLVKVRLRRSRWIVTVADSRSVAADVPASLARALGLPGGSTRVVASLLNGEDLKAHAAKAGISTNTARSHLKVAFRATGTHRQADLVLLAARVLRDLGAGGEAASEPMCRTGSGARAPLFKVRAGS